MRGDWPQPHAVSTGRRLAPASPAPFSAPLSPSVAVTWCTQVWAALGAEGEWQSARDPQNHPRRALRGVPGFSPEGL